MKKTLSIILCVIMLFLSMCISTSAVGKAQNLSALDGYYIEDVFSDNNRAVIVTTKSKDIIIFSTTDNKNFKKLNLADYVGQCKEDKYNEIEEPNKYYMREEEYEHINCACNFEDGKFVAILNRMNSYEKVSYDYYTDEYDETYSTTSKKSVVIETTDFKNIKTYNLPNYISEIRDYSIIKTSKGEYLISGTIGKEENETKNIFYITKDFVTFAKYQAPLMPTYKGKYIFSAVGNGVTVKNNYSVARGDGDVPPAFSDVYYTEDYKTFTKVCTATREGQQEQPVIISNQFNTDELYVFDHQGCGTNKNKIVIKTINKNTGKSKQIISIDFTEPNRYYYWIIYNNYYFDLILINKDGSKELYVINLKTKNVEKRNINFSNTEEISYKSINNKMVTFSSKNAYVTDYSKPESTQIIDISKTGIIMTESSDCYIKYFSFSLNNSVFLISNILDYNKEKYTTKFLEIPIETQQNKIGDLNGDNIINSADALKILQFSVGSITLDDNLKDIADVNNDGKINSSDALRILQYSVGQIKEL